MVWDRFFPSDLESILSNSPDGSLLLKRVTSQKQLFFSLCDNPVTFDNGKKSFSLDKKNGKKGYRLSAGDLGIAWSDNQEYGEWIFLSWIKFAEVAELLLVCWLEIRGEVNISMPSPSTCTQHTLCSSSLTDLTGLMTSKSIGSSAPTGVSDGYFPKSRGDGWFSEVAQLVRVSWLEIGGKINTSMLSPATLYTAHLVFNFSIAAAGPQLVAATMGLVGAETSSRRTFCWQRPEMFSQLQYRNARRRMFGSSPARNVRRRVMGSYAAEAKRGGNYPKGRGDGGLEIELGEFFTKEGEEEALEMRVLENIGIWKQGLVVEGIEIRPKEERG
ncbi:PREDICTED: putative F-box protein PP2-B12 [Populus euphratica]|uniref:F-box protein PP2-B12 n=1 Tax=Populus euphratica TaxID=75702 RepID=A0AAJ6UKM9_POPEU|nr:PREDICTED: putative F-box protein PP2-B12 [Populus euphratica]